MIRESRFPDALISTRKAKNLYSTVPTIVNSGSEVLASRRVIQVHWPTRVRGPRSNPCFLAAKLICNSCWLEYLFPRFSLRLYPHVQNGFTPPFDIWSFLLVIARMPMHYPEDFSVPVGPFSQMGDWLSDWVIKLGIFESLPSAMQSKPQLAWRV